MPRHHRIWNAATQTQVEVQFTAEEETARDAEEAQAATDRAAEATIAARVVVLDAKLQDDSITFDELKELMRLR